MSFTPGSLNEYGTLKLVAVRQPAAAFVSNAKIDAEWRDLNYHSRPDLEHAISDHGALESLLRTTGAELIALPDAPGLTLDSIYARDALVMTPKGLVKPRMGKPQRRMESDINGAALAKAAVPVIGSITGDGKMEGGDLVWMDNQTVLVGIGYRTNTEGARQLQTLVGSDVNVISFDLPHYKGRSDVFHLMSVVSPIDHDLAVVYRPLMPVRLVEFLEARGLDFVDVPEEEFESMGCNVLAIAPRNVVMVDGNPETEKRLRAAGASVHVYRGQDISRKGEGGPTCLTRPLVRG